MEFTELSVIHDAMDMRMRDLVLQASPVKCSLVDEDTLPAPSAWIDDLVEAGVLETADVSIQFFRILDPEDGNVVRIDKTLTCNRKGALRPRGILGESGLRSSEVRVEFQPQ